MNNLLDLMRNNALFGVLLSVGAFYLGQVLFKKSKGFFLFAPLFVAMVVGIVFLLVTGISYDDYNKGGSVISFFLEPATICFAIPLYKKRDVLKKYWVQILGGLTFGSILSIAAIDAIGKLFGLSDTLLASLLPQAATTAIAMPTAVSIGGIPEIASLACILNAVIIYSLGKPLVKFFHLNHPIATGIGLGTAGHTMGASVAAEIGEIEASMASIALVVVGVIVAILVPVLYPLLNNF